MTCVRVVFGLFIALVGASGCNTVEELAADTSNAHDGQGGLPEKQWLKKGTPKASSTGTAPLKLLPQDKGNLSPACLDGSPYGFYFKPSLSGSKKWTVSIEGGGWCYSECECYLRSKMSLGSSKSWAPEAGCNCMNVDSDGTLDEDCNCLYMPYGDGASFSGFRENPWPVQQPTKPFWLQNDTRCQPDEIKDKVLYFRGIKNFDATMQFLFENGLKDAEEFVLTGGSAGGLSTFLHTDRIRNRILKEAPNIKRVTAAPVVGYFLDHANFAHNGANYTNKMRWIYHMQNLSFGWDGALKPECESAFPENPHYCFMSPHMQQFIQTPFFMFNSKYDAWQLGNELQTRWVTPAEHEAVLQYGKDFMKQFSPVETESKNGAMITSCICHGCDWQTLEVNGKTSYQHYADWFFGKTPGGNGSVHIDIRGPNGDGAISDPRCSKWP